MSAWLFCRVSGVGLGGSGDFTFLGILPVRSGLFGSGIGEPNDCSGCELEATFFWREGLFVLSITHSFGI